MGLFSRFKKKEQAVQQRLKNFVDSVMDSFKGLREDLSNQSRWITYLHNNHILIRDEHDKHRTVIKEDIGHVKSWINHIYDTTKDQEAKLEALQHEIGEAFKVYNENLGRLYEMVNDRSDIESLRAELLSEIEGMKKHHEEMLAKVSSVQPAAEASSISTPEQRLLNFLVNQADPMSYDQISLKTGHSINTVRVNMNSLKKRNLIDETLLPSGVKLFSVKNREKVKKIYNVEYL